jgi:hypothetical protein
MAQDDDKPEADDDPWAGLEAEGLPELGGDFSFSFDDEPADESPADPAADPDPDPAADPAAAEDPAEIAAAADEPVEDEFNVASASEPAEEPFAEQEADPFAEQAPEPVAEQEADPFAAAADAAIDDWLGADGDAAAAAAESSVLGGVASEEPFVTEGEVHDCGASESSVEIGTGTSGIASPSSIEAFGSFGDGEQEGASQAVEAESADPFAAMDDLPAAEAGDADDFNFMAGAIEAEADEPAETASEESCDQFSGVGVAAAATTAVNAAADDAGEKQPAPKPKRPAPPKKKKPSMVGQLIGVIVGGALAIPITLAILLWGFGKDPFGVAAMVPDSLALLVPAKFRPGGDAIDLAGAPSLDTLGGNGEVGGGGDEEAGLPSDADLATDPEPEPDPMPDEPAATDLAALDNGLDGGDDSDKDPLMDLLDESDEEESSPPAPEPAAVPPPPPEPEPLDVTRLDTAIAEATAAMEAVAALDDPADPTRRRLLAKWYGALAGYAEELAALEQVAAETGRPFGPVEERATSVRSGLADHPDLRDALAVLTRDWISYARRKSDGVVTPATFEAARRTGPWWRSQVTLPATADRPAAELIVMTRTEPAVAPGDTVVVTGLTVADDVIWAAEVRPVVVDAFALPGS